MTDSITEADIRPYCEGFNKEQLSQALNICNTYQLTPVKRQVHFSLRNKKDGNGNWTKVMSFLVTVDGLRGIAERGGAYEGQAGPFWCGPDGKWVDVWLKDDLPAAAKIGVYKKNFREPLTAVAKFEEYKQTDKQGNVTGLWVKMPATMIAKCAEALAIRRAFPDETSGIYTVEEMQQAEKKETVKEEKKEESLIKDLPDYEPVTEDELNKLLTKVSKAIDQEEYNVGVSLLSAARQRIEWTDQDKETNYMEQLSKAVKDSPYYKGK